MRDVTVIDADAGAASASAPSAAARRERSGGMARRYVGALTQRSHACLGRPWPATSTCSTRPVARDFVAGARNAIVEAGSPRANAATAPPAAPPSADLRGALRPLRRPPPPADHDQAPRPPVPDYLLRSIVRCERCDGRMHGTPAGRNESPRYYCSTRRKTARLRPAAHRRATDRGADRASSSPTSAPAKQCATKSCTASLTARTPTPKSRPPAPPAQRAPQAATRPLRTRRPRTRRLLSKRDALDAELDGLAPGPAPDLDGARASSRTSAASGRTRPIPNPAASSSSSSSNESGSTDKRIVAVRPTPAFAALFPASRQERRGVKERERRDSNPRPPA